MTGETRTIWPLIPTFIGRNEAKALFIEQEKSILYYISMKVLLG